MITFRCTQRVLKRFRIIPEGSPPAPISRLGDWYANLLNVGRTRWVLCVNERSLLPVILPARRDSFPHAFADSLEHVLRLLGVPAEVAAAEASFGHSWGFAKTDSRRVLGTMNDFAYTLELTWWHLHDPLRAALALADTPCSPLRMESPDRVTFALLGVAGVPRRFSSV